MVREIDLIETERLWLRGIDASDAGLIVQWRSDPVAYQYFKSPHQISFEEHMNWYKNIYLVSTDRYDWICIEKESGNRIGVVGLYKGEKDVELNYLLSPEGQHKGYAVEAVKGLIDYASKKWNSKKLVAEIHRNNQPSIALVKKLGFNLISQSDPFVIYGIEV